MKEQDVFSATPTQVYLKVLPGEFSRLDLTTLDTSDTNFAYSWLNQLLKKGQVQLSFRPNFQAAETLQHLYFSARNHERVKGLPIVGFGYPMIVWEQGDDQIVAPLFIWQVMLSPAPETLETWILTHRKTDTVVYNQLLVNLLRKEYGVDIEPTLAKVVEDGKVSVEELVHSCTELAGMLGIENTIQNIALAEYPSPGALTKAFEQGTVQWSGVVGFFPPPYFPSETSAPITDDQKTKVKQKHDLGLLPLDTDQTAALQAIFKEQKVLVKGVSGTGKTHLLVHLLTNALSNGNRCLVIAENVGALRQVQKRLEQLGLLSYSFLLQEGAAEKPVLFNLLRTIANTETSTGSFDDAGFRVALDKCQRLKAKLDEQYSNLRRTIFGPYNWTETVGLFLRSNRVEGKELLASHLHTQDFKFIYDEYLQLREGIRISQPLYQKINTLRHPLSNLHRTIFVKQSQAEGFKFVSQQIHTFLEKAQKLHHRYITKTNFYADRLAEQYEGIYGDFYNALIRLKDRIADFTTKYGADFEQTSAGALKLRGVFSGKVKAVLEARDEVTAQHQALVRKFEQTSAFDFQFPMASEGKNIQKVRQNLDAFEKALLRWRDSFPALVQEEIQRLGAKNVREELGLKEQIQELEYGLDQLVEELNGVGLYQESLENKMLTIPKRQKYLEEVIEQLENTRLYLHEYAIFYDWQRHWLQLPENATKIIRALVKVKPNDWIQAFESWYLHNCLNLYGNAALTVEEESITDFVKHYEALKKLLPGQISQRLREGRVEALKNLKSSNREAFTLFFDKKKQAIPQDKSFAALLEPMMDSVTATFPIILATPYAATTALPFSTQPFDYVLFDEAQYLAEPEFLSICALAKKAVFLEEPRQLPSLEPSSVAAWAAANAIPTFHLKNSYQQYPGNVLQLSENVQSEFAIHFEQVDGRYDEQNGTNDEEAQYIITLLNEVKPTSQRTFPTVGIVCFTIAQRDLIASYLLKIRQRWSVGAEKIQQLERNGLGVFYLDELRGQHFDVLIISNTYGIINAKGEVTEHTAQLNNSETLAYVQLLLSRPLRELFIVNSIPQASLQNWLKMPQHAGYFLLANYLNYNQFLHKNLEESRLRIQDWLNVSPSEEKEYIFAKEVSIALQPYLGQERVVVGGVHGDLLVQGAHETQPPLLLQPDGFFGETSATDYIWEDTQRAKLLAQGIVYQPFWSVNWWKNPRQEARKLAGIVIKSDHDFAKTLPSANPIEPNDVAIEMQQSDE